MFYSTVILTKKGTLGQIWIAAHWENKLTKKQIKDIVVSVCQLSIFFAVNFSFSYLIFQ